MTSILDIPDEKLTPGMRQYKEAKLENPDCIILLRMGDFYEMFYEDAEICARDLEITLTARGKGEKRAPLAGIPFHALDSYLGKLVKKGHKVAIIEQLEDPKKAKGLVKRGCVRIVTPGTLIESTLLDANQHNFIISILGKAKGFSFCFADLSTGELMIGNCKSKNELINEIIRRSCTEALLPESLLVDIELVQQLRDLRVFVSSQDDFYFRKEQAQKIVLKHFNKEYLESTHIKQDEDKNNSINVTGALLNYLESTQKKELSHFTSISNLAAMKIMQLDRQTMTNLELVTNSKGETKNSGSLLHVLDKTVTNSGARLLKQIIKEPLLKEIEINKRLDAVEELLHNSPLRNKLQELLKTIYDIKRLITRVSYGNASPKDLLALKRSFEVLPHIAHYLKNCKTGMLQELAELKTFPQLLELLKKAIKEEANNHIREGGVIARGYNDELDEILNISSKSKQLLQEILIKEKETTGISNLRLSYNRVFGYFLEVSKKNIEKVPSHYIRKQTTANSERYITEDLKVLEEKILNSQEKILELEYLLYQQVLAQCAKEITQIKEVASDLAMLDVLCSFATVSLINSYTRPEIVKEEKLEIVEGRHPVVERLQNEFIPNSVVLQNGEIMIITGPNTSGKSTVMRQCALIVLMAQIGCFVPANTVKMSIVDRIFTRVGAHDDLAAGQSTFMLEMLETATILKHATNNSLVILDEIGRGTSTFDGVAIAWSCVEYIYNKIKAKTMFATHYHILNKLAKQFEGIHNYNVAVREVKGEIVYLRKLVRGGCDQSHGIHVARMAGVPREVVVRAQEIQKKLQEDDDMMRKVQGKKVREQMDLSGFSK